MVTRSNEHDVRVRFAPSPTGSLHLGSALVALANAAYARTMGGSFVLRIDDTDQSRSREEDTFELLRLMRWLELNWDDGPIHQRDRAERYAAAIERLRASDRAYPCFCGTSRLQELREQQVATGQPPRYDGRCRSLDRAEAQRSIDAGAPHVLRFAIPEGCDVEFDDLVRGRVTIPAGAFGDPVLCRADGSAGYLLATVVDDAELSITHVIRGEDHLTNTARQILLFEALDATRLPTFAHLPLLRDTDGRKLSKRDPLGTLDELVDEGFLPVTVRRYLAELLGQGAVDLLPQEGSGVEVAPFSIDAVPTGAPRVDRARLESLGREDMAQLSTSDLLAGLEIAASAANEPLVRELAAAPSRVALRGELRLVFDGPGAGDLPFVLRFAAPDEHALESANTAWDLATELLREAPDTDDLNAWAAEFISRYKATGKERGLGARDLMRPLRVALTGSTSGPSLDLVLAAIGRGEALRRVNMAAMVAEEVAGGGNHATFG